jgi:hypothetical protein
MVDGAESKAAFPHLDTEEELGKEQGKHAVSSQEIWSDKHGFDILRDIGRLCKHSRSYPKLDLAKGTTDVRLATVHQNKFTSQDRVNKSASEYCMK